ncbi:MAG TPA: lysine--tRNA ligase [Candidatus Limnocylindria bacterium]|nr:lysine--tRNA ligase [Candidatus Limnocylindria bacterium]
MFWADEVAAAAQGDQVVNDSKTPSGTIHVGALRGVVIHDVLTRALRDKGLPARFLYGIDDLDPMDSASLASREGVAEHMGRPLADVPAPRGSQHPSWARHFAASFLETFERLGIHPEFYWASEQYRAGLFDGFIREALDSAAEVRRIYREVSKVRHGDDWHPVQVICERCGRIGTTLVDDWDGETVHYRCLPDFVSWATGCGHSGRVSPFGGRAKLPWNLHWVAKWRLFGVTVEAAGKDLSTRGGSRDRSDALARQVFRVEPPRNVPYEFLTIGGRKMKSSAGTGAAAHAMVELLPPELIRFLMLRYRPQAAIEFDPSGETVPRLFDEYDSWVTEAVAGPSEGADPEESAHRRRVVELSQLPGHELPTYFLPPFVQVATYSQMPGATPQVVAEQIGRHRGAPLSGAELHELEARLSTAERWLPEWAPERIRFRVALDDLPEETAALTEQQRSYLEKLADTLEAVESWDGEALQTVIFDGARGAELSANRAFNAIYTAFLGRGSGPRAGWLLASLDREFVVDRLRVAAGAGEPAATTGGGQ